MVTNEQHLKLLLAEVETLPSLLPSSAAAANVVMLGAGYFNPLKGYMNLADTLSVAESMHTTEGLFRPIPIINLTKDVSGIQAGTRVALRDPNKEGNPAIAIMDVDAIESVTDMQIVIIADEIFGTVDMNHPGVATFLNHGRNLLSGEIQVLDLSYFQADFPDTFRTALEIRDEVAQRKWQKVVVFQSRNPIHRAHEELCRMAMERLGADGVIVHMLLGKVKQGDLPASVRNGSFPR